MICAIIPVYNESTALLNSTLTHLLSFSGITKIVVVATNNDPQLICIKELIQHVSLDTQRIDIAVCTKPGRAVQMNQGAQIAQAQILLFLHVDTRLPNQADELIMSSVKDAWGRFDVRLDNDGWPYRMIGWFMNRRSRLTGISTGDQAIFVSTRLFKQLNGFPEQALMEDIEFCKQAKKHYPPVNLNAKVITSARRWQKKGVVKTILLMWWLRGLYVFGVSPDRLSAMYKQIR